MIKVNGELKDLDGITAEKLLEELGYSTQRVAVELNMEILPKAEYGTVVLKDGDSLEIVRFVGGG